jgi:hypothetical protein
MIEHAERITSPHSAVLMMHLGGAPARVAPTLNRKSRPYGGMSALPRILLKKSFRDEERNFSGPLMRSARGDVRDHIVLHKNDHGRSYRAWQALQR